MVNEIVIDSQGEHADSAVSQIDSLLAQLRQECRGQRPFRATLTKNGGESLLVLHLARHEPDTPAAADQPNAIDNGRSILIPTTPRTHKKLLDLVEGTIEAVKATDFGTKVPPASSGTVDPRFIILPPGVTEEQRKAAIEILNKPTEQKDFEPVMKNESGEIVPVPKKLPPSQAIEARSEDDGKA